MLDLSNIPVTDAHCHPFDPSKDEGDFRLHFSLSMWGAIPELTNNTVFSYKAIKELGKILAINSTEPDIISKERDKLYRNNPKEYIAKLFNSTKV